MAIHKQNLRSKVVVLPAYNAERTLKLTYKDLPRHMIDLIILVDNASSDNTVTIARELNLKTFVHNKNYGYGANQKTCYIEALQAGADIVAMVHPDYQYDPSLIPLVIKPLDRGEADVVLASRMMGDSPIKQGMPWWRNIANRFLTRLENLVFGLNLSDYHTGYPAYSRRVLETVNFTMNSDKFIFDQEIIAQIVYGGFRIKEVPVRTSYFPEASSASALDSIVYGMGILWLLLKLQLHKKGIPRQRQFESPKARYTEVCS